MSIKKKTSDPSINRRDFLKIGSAGAALGGLGLAALPKTVVANKVEKETAKAIIIEHDDFPNEVRDDYKPHPSYQNVPSHGLFGEQLGILGVDVDQEALKHGKIFVQNQNYHYVKGKKGFDQKSKALMAGAWALANTGSGPMVGLVGDYGLLSWDNNHDKYPLALIDNNFVQKEKCEFDSTQEASAIIKRAARMYGADLVGITKRDKRWDYSKNFNYVPPMARKITPMGPKQFQRFNEIGGEGVRKEMESHTPDKWLYELDEQAGFTPKTVIVMAVEMDYEGISCSPSEIAAGAAGEGYSRMTKLAHQMAVMIRQLGYNAIPCGNDTGMSVPYGIAAGLGEGSRMGTLVTFKYGPRVRLCKVYTDMEFVEYDKPKTFGVENFCKNCMRCADACPSKAISFDEEPSFEPTHDNKDNAYFNAPGVKKWYLNSKKCFQQWAESGVDCANCVASCPYNKPDFWHHQMVNGITAFMPGAVHGFMREMDILFGYGNVSDESAVDTFFAPEGRKYNGH